MLSNKQKAVLYIAAFEVLLFGCYFSLNYALEYFDVSKPKMATIDIVTASLIGATNVIVPFSIWKKYCKPPRRQREESSELEETNSDLTI